MADPWKTVAHDGPPPCDGHTTYIGINSAGYACCFNTMVHGVCIQQTAKGAYRQMSDLRQWRLLDRPPIAGVNACPAPSINEAWNRIRAEARALAGIGKGFSALLAAVEDYGTACAKDAAGAPVVPEVTDAMVDAYLQANDAYWKRTDDLPTPPDKWRTGTAREATRESLRVALGVALPEWRAAEMTHDEAVAADIAADRPDACPLADAVLLDIARKTGLRGEMHGTSPAYAKVMLRAYVDAVFATTQALRAAWATPGVLVGCTYPGCKCDGPGADGGCGDPRTYTDAIGQAGEDYLKQFPHAHPLPAQWRWSELWGRMHAAAHGVTGGRHQTFRKADADAPSHPQGVGRWDMTTIYEPKGNELCDAETGRQLVVILPVGISKALAAELARVCAEYLNDSGSSPQGTGQG